MYLFYNWTNRIINVACFVDSLTYACVAGENLHVAWCRPVACRNAMRYPTADSSCSWNRAAASNGNASVRRICRDLPFIEGMKTPYSTLSRQIFRTYGLAPHSRRGSSLLLQSSGIRYLGMIRLHLACDCNAYVHQLQPIIRSDWHVARDIIFL